MSESCPPSSAVFVPYDTHHGGIYTNEKLEATRRSVVGACFIKGLYPCL